MSEIIKDYLTQVYAPDEADQTYEQIERRLAEAHARLPEKSANVLFSERDVVLITYGDSLRRTNEAPLQTLQQFARDHLTGRLSLIHILPFFPYSSDDGFSVIDFYQVDPNLGTWADMAALGQHFDLMYDAVFNHMSAQSAWFQSFLAGDPEYAGLFRTESPQADLSMVTRPRATPLLTPFQKADGEMVHVWTTFSADQVDLDFRQPNTLLRFIDILLFYVEQGARIIRLDAIAYLWKVVGTSSIHLEEMHIIIRLLRAILDVVAPQVLILTETNVPHAENISYFGDGYNEAQMVYNFTLPPLLLYVMSIGQVDKLRGWVNTLQTPTDSTAFFNFTASHDGIGVRPVEGMLNESELALLIDHVQTRGGRVSYKANVDGSKSPYELNISYVDAITDPDLPQDLQVKQFLISQGIMLVLAGMPAIYIHSLLGSHNDLEGMAQTGQNRSINRAKLDADALLNELNQPKSFRAQVFNAYREMIAKRIEQAAFHPKGAQQALNLGNPAVFALLREAPEGEQKILALFNISEEGQTLDLSALMPQPCVDILTGESISPQTTLNPFEMRWLDLS